MRIDCMLLFVVFMVLKLCNVITWSWWWVTAPLWMPAVFCLGIVICCILLNILVKIK